MNLFGRMLKEGKKNRDKKRDKKTVTLITRTPIVDHYAWERKRVKELKFVCEKVLRDLVPQSVFTTLMKVAPPSQEEHYTLYLAMNMN